MNDRAYRSGDDEQSSNVPACPVCGRVTTVEHTGKPGLEWWCGPCNTTFPEDGQVAGWWADRTRKLRAAGRREAAS